LSTQQTQNPKPKLKKTYSITIVKTPQQNLKSIPNNQTNLKTSKKNVKNLRPINVKLDDIVHEGLIQKTRSYLAHPQVKRHGNVYF